MRKLKTLAWLSIALAICFQLFNDVACYEKSISEIALWFWFPLIPLVPAITFARQDKPVNAIAAALVIIPFYLFAYYADCVMPYEGGGASMVYVIVVMFGTPVAIISGLLTGYIARRINS
jgi:hypothetical protein